MVSISIIDCQIISLRMETKNGFMTYFGQMQNIPLLTWLTFWVIDHDLLAEVRTSQIWTKIARFKEDISGYLENDFLRSLGSRPLTG